MSPFLRLPDSPSRRFSDSPILRVAVSPFLRLSASPSRRLADSPFLRILAWLCCLCFSVVSLSAAELRIAAASDLKFVLEDLIADFNKTHTNTEIKVNYGSSGNFYAQLMQRAPFDLFLSADMNYPAKLIEAGHATIDSTFVYGVGRIVIWVPTNSVIDPTQSGAQSLTHPSVRKIAIANPQHAPYGKAAVEAMTKLGVYDTVKGRLVYGENIAQTAQYVDTGAADIGIIALSLAVAPTMKSRGRYWEIPIDAYSRLEQGGIILSWTKQPGAARQFRSFILSEHGRNTLQRYGFSLPEQKAK